MIKIAACQPVDIQGDLEKSLSVIVDYSSKAEALNAKLLCFPECFMQGYIVHEGYTKNLAIDLTSTEFKSVLDRLRSIQLVLVIGLIEKEGQHIFNTAVVIKEGKVLGRYRKHMLVGTENGVFEAGSDFPVFDIDGLRFGINICNDLNYPECAEGVSGNKADLLVCPCNNMMSIEKAEIWKLKHNQVRAKRCIETGLWLMSSDVTGKRKGNISYGPTAIINPKGIVTEQLPLNEPGLLVYEVSNK